MIRNILLFLAPPPPSPASIFETNTIVNILHQRHCTDIADTWHKSFGQRLPHIFSFLGRQCEYKRCENLDNYRFGHKWAKSSLKCQSYTIKVGTGQNYLKWNSVLTRKLEFASMDRRTNLFGLGWSITIAITTINQLKSIINTSTERSNVRLRMLPG